MYAALGGRWIVRDVFRDVRCLSERIEANDEVAIGLGGMYGN
jgi:hypothetical protein